MIDFREVVDSWRIKFMGVVHSVQQKHRTEVSRKAVASQNRWSNVDQTNDDLMEKLFKIANESDWEEVRRLDSIRISRKKLPAGVTFGGGDAKRGEKFYVVKVTATIDAPAEKLFNLFLDNSRVPEYNEHCRQLRDLEQIGKNTKISHSVTGRFAGGLLKARDFVARVHHRTLRDGTYVVLNSPEVHEDAEKTSQYTRPAALDVEPKTFPILIPSPDHVEDARARKWYVRGELLLGGTVIRERQDDPKKADFMVITHVNPGGIADTKLGSKVINLLCANSPITFIKNLQIAARKA